MKTNKKKGKLIIIFTAVAIVTAVVGLYLLYSPSREREKVENAQEALIEDILRDINGENDAPEDMQMEVEITITDGILPFDDDTAAVEDDYTEGEEYGYEEEPTAHEAVEYIPLPSFVPVYADPVPDSAFNSGITGIGILNIESIGLWLPVAEGIEYASLRIAPGRVPQTAQIGDIGNAVIAGHRNYAYGSMFNRLGEMQIGDIVQYQARNGELMEFEVFEIAEIEPENQIAFIQPLNDSIITLYTCTPVRVASHRLIIRAQRIS